MNDFLSPIYGLLFLLAVAVVLLLVKEGVPALALVVSGIRRLRRRRR